MDALTAIRGSLDMAEMIGTAYLSDLSDDDLMRRPHAQCNHLNWQIGHLIVSENHLMKHVSADIPDLPKGFAEKYAKEAATSDDPGQFVTKDELMAAYKAQRAATLRILESQSPEDLDRPTGIEYAPTVGSLIRMQGDHWLMHCGQWVIVRRELGKPVVI